MLPLRLLHRIEYIYSTKHLVGRRSLLKDIGEAQRLYVLLTPLLA